MARSESKAHKESEYLERDYSSGDSNKMKCTQLYHEENNNDIEELSKDFSEMGCIVDVVKRPPNICVETCVYEESESEDDENSQNKETEEVHYSDEFEEETISEVEEPKHQSQTGLNKNKSDLTIGKTSLKLSKSHSSMSTNKPPSVTGKSSNYGSISVPQTRRVNMSFTNERLREIERHNHILLSKILSARNNRRSSIPPREQQVKKPVPSAAVHRKNQQRKIDHENMILLKKIQRAKSSSCSIRR